MSVPPGGAGWLLRRAAGVPSGWAGCFSLVGRPAGRCRVRGAGLALPAPAVCCFAVGERLARAGLALAAPAVCCLALGERLARAGSVLAGALVGSGGAVVVSAAWVSGA